MPGRGTKLPHTTWCSQKKNLIKNIKNQQLSQRGERQSAHLYTLQRASSLHRGSQA